MNVRARRTTTTLVGPNRLALAGATSGLVVLASAGTALLVFAGTSTTAGTAAAPPLPASEPLAKAPGVVVLPSTSAQSLLGLPAAERGVVGLGRRSTGRGEAHAFRAPALSSPVFVRVRAGQPAAPAFAAPAFAAPAFAAPAFAAPAFAAPAEPSPAALTPVAVAPDALIPVDLLLSAPTTTDLAALLRTGATAPVTTGDLAPAGTSDQPAREAARGRARNQVDSDDHTELGKATGKVAEAPDNAAAKATKQRYDKG